jgi:hypothetical protein
MFIPIAKIESWQNAMQRDGLRGCFACLMEAVSHGYVCKQAQEFSFSEFTFTCPRHNVPTLASREFILKLAHEAGVVLRPDCQDPVRELKAIDAFWKYYYISGAYYKLQRACAGNPRWKAPRAIPGLPFS